MMRKAAVVTASLIALMVLGWGHWSNAGPKGLRECPVSLSNPDGQQLELLKYDLRVAVHEALALTEMEMVFKNPENRQMEGRFKYLLPPGATISRFAKEVNGKLMEGEVVERQRARSVYRQILHTMRDPALLEQDQGNRFSAKVFPIPANGTVRLVLSYSQLIPAKNELRKLTVPMAGMPKIGAFSATAIVHETPYETLGAAPFFGKIEKTDKQPQRVTRNAKDFKPEEDLELTFVATPKATGEHAIKAGSFQMLSFRPELLAKKQEVRRDWVFYLDTSASNADQEVRRLEAQEKLLRYMTEKRKHNFTAYAFDLEVAPILDGTTKPNATYWEYTTSALRRRHALGATDLAKTLKHIGDLARAQKGAQRFVLASDGIATWGKREVGDVIAALGEWPKNDVLHALVIGQKQDERMLKAIIEKTHGRIVSLPLNNRMEEELPKAVEELAAATGHTFEFYDEGAAWIHPRIFRDVRPGQELIVYSEMKDGAPAKPGVVQRGPTGRIVKERTFDKAPIEVPDFAPLLRRQAYKAFMTHLEKKEQKEKDAAKKAELRKKRIETSVKNRVLCPLTALLVLETERDYRRFGIDRRALAEIMLVGKSGIELKKRTVADVPAPVKKPKPTKVMEKKRVARKADKAKAEAPGARRSRGRALARPAEAMDEAEAEESAGAPLRDAAANSISLRAEARQGASSSSSASSGGGSTGGGRFGGGGGYRDPARPSAPHPEGAAPGAAPRAATANRSRVAEDAAADAESRTSTGRPARAAPPRTEAARRVVVAQLKKKALPKWTKQYTTRPSDAEVAAIRSKIEAKPRDRLLRNDLAEALGKLKKWDQLQAATFQWLPFDPENPQVFEFLGTSASRLGDKDMALRAITSIAEVAPSSAAMLARCGWLLLAAEKPTLAEPMFQAALKQRQDNPNIHRGLALSQWMAGKHEAAATTLEKAMARSFNNRYGDVKRVFREELGYVFRGWQKEVQAQKDDTHKRIAKRAAKLGVRLDRTDAFRVTLGWETDANDVDLHVVDPNGEECFYSHKKTHSGLNLYSDQTRGLGPEVIRTAKTISGLYHVGVKYYSAGAMGTSRGMVVIMRPRDGVVSKPIIRPFALVPKNKVVRHLFAEEF